METHGLAEIQNTSLDLKCIQEIRTLFTQLFLVICSKILRKRGVYKSTDGGTTWNKVPFSNARSGAVDISMDPEKSRCVVCEHMECQKNSTRFFLWREKDLLFGKQVMAEKRGMKYLKMKVFLKGFLEL